MERSIRGIAILAAMAAELKPVASRLGLKRMHGAENPFLLGACKGVPVIAAVTNMGMAAAQQRTQELFALRAAIDHVFVVGIAGALQPELAIGEVIVPATVVDARDGSEHHPVNPGTRTAAGTLYSSDRLYFDDAGRAQLQRRRVTAVDMESGAIASECERHGCPYTIVRAVSDRVAQHAADFDVLRLAKPDGSPRRLAALGYLLRRPQRTPLLLSLARGSRKAIAASSTELLSCIEQLLLRG